MGKFMNVAYKRHNSVTVVGVRARTVVQAKKLAQEILSNKGIEVSVSQLNVVKK